MCTWTAKRATPGGMQKINRLLTWPLILFVLFLMSLATTALAAASPPSPDVDAGAWAKALYDAATSKEWGALFALVLTGLTYAMRRWILGWVAWFKTPFGGLVAGFLTSLGATWALSLWARAPFSWGLVATSLASAAASAGVWEWLKAHIPGMQQAADKATEPAKTGGPA